MMVEPIEHKDILDLMEEYGLTKTWLAGEMKLTKQAVNNVMNQHGYTEKADYRFRLLATYILKDYAEVAKRQTQQT